MEEGVAAENYKKVLAITDRKQAIKTISSAKRYYFDCRKGHETYQEINGVRQDFDGKGDITTL
jgi:UDP-N-acetylmuramoyl-L-alanyl-D-glutamate--2,6-diaminopimelate ligase